ncbi:MAG: succinate dehydrogenase assembly factor 2 [Halioglobus sp.]|jgi:antitoxin CptB|nr:TPR repeat region superfamily protein [marine gamma proteobacterium HTCC2148]MBT6126941.1 succinate dehydrogenase assembly factor 2 [Halieaceae bacterium]MBT7720331.1 succinate dehydrogenase assembly factor 2 [Halieaceae bacterium]MDG1388404.1 succinate dehydrogenase assembly factor 2 [Halioglobus sp.]MDG2327609.1 succinate dehydrogenase assembly factor 2 [Halioglobus sp.]
MVSDEEINRMRWAARRGMLELDLVLEPFVQSRFATLDEADRIRFKDLMLSEDQDLFAWFMRREQPQDRELALIVKKILDFTHTSPDDR